MDDDRITAAPRFCSRCGGRLAKTQDGKVVCAVCQSSFYDGPTVLVVALIFAENRMLLMKRGVAPYAGTWAPPGGFVEANESPQEAAAREVAEEVGVLIDPAQLVPHAIGSEPALNQVYYGFLGVLDRVQKLTPSAPEALDARWFTVEEYPVADMWEPAARFDYQQLFDQTRSGHFHFYQWTGKSVRLFGPFSTPKRS